MQSDQIRELSRIAAWGGNTRSHIGPRGGVWLARVGGLSPVIQTTKSVVPEPRGIWCFVWPYIEPFLIGSTNDHGIVDPTKGQKSRYELMKEHKTHLRKFCYVGDLWTPWPNAGRFAKDIKGDWFLIDTWDFGNLVSKETHKMRNVYQTKYLPKDLFDRGNRLKGPLNYSKDWMEVYVPANRGDVVGKPNKHKVNPEDLEDLDWRNRYDEEDL